MMRTIHYLNRKFIGKMKTLIEKHEEETAAVAASASALSAAAEHHVEQSLSTNEEEQSEDTLSSCGGSGSSSSSDYKSSEEEHHYTIHPVDNVAPLLGSSRVVHVPKHTRETVPQNMGIQIIQKLKQQPQYHEAMADTVDTLLADGCCRISDERMRRLMTKHLINIGSFEKKCDMLCELLQGIYILQEDTMRHGAELYRKYNEIMVSEVGVPTE